MTYSPVRETTEILFSNHPTVRKTYAAAVCGTSAVDAGRDPKPV